MSLHELQQQFQNTIYDNGSTESLPLAINHAHLYRNNTFHALTKALQKIYPSIERIVGEEFFCAMAQAYIHQNPSTYKDLNSFGDCLATFLVTFPPAKTLPYLAEVAQFEWGCHEVFHAPETKGFDLARLAAIAASEYPQVKFRLHPACRIYDFYYPIYRIWRLCQEKSSEESIDFNSGGENILIFRQYGNVEIILLDKADFEFLYSLGQGQTLEIACDAALGVDANFDVIAKLQQFVVNGVLINF